MCSSIASAQKSAVPSAGRFVNMAQQTVYPCHHCDLVFDEYADCRRHNHEVHQDFY